MPQRPVALLRAAQAICLLALPATALLILLTGTHPARFLFLPLMLWAEAEAFLLCGRMCKASAFCAANEKTLGRISLALVIMGALMIPFGAPLMDFLLAGLQEVSPVLRYGLPAFTLLTLAVMVHAVQVLMRRARTLQEETDLTI